LPYELDAARCYKLMHMGTSHAIRPARQTPNVLLDTATYCRSHDELDAARFYEYIDFTCNKPDAPARIRLSLTHREAERQKQ